MNLISDPKMLSQASKMNSKLITKGKESGRARLTKFHDLIEFQKIMKNFKSDKLHYGDLGNEDDNILYIKKA